MAPADQCPICLLYERLCAVTGLLEDAVPIAQQTGGQLPLGLGGTIALARQRTAEARQQVGAVARLAPGQGAAELGQRLEALHGRLNGWLSAGDFAAVAGEARFCRVWAYAIAASYYTARRGAPWPVTGWG